MEKLSFEDGSTYEGETADGKPHGKGKMTYPNGKTEQGTWDDKNDVFIAKLK